MHWEIFFSNNLKLAYTWQSFQRHSFKDILPFFVMLYPQPLSRGAFLYACHLDKINKLFFVWHVWSYLMLPYLYLRVKSLGSFMKGESVFVDIGLHREGLWCPFANGKHVFF